MRSALLITIFGMCCGTLPAQTLNSTSVPPPKNTDGQTEIINCSSAHFLSEDSSRFTCSMATALVKPECAGCWLNGSATGTIAVIIPTTRPADDTKGLPLCPGTAGSIISNSCTDSGPKDAVPATDPLKKTGNSSAPK